MPGPQAKTFANRVIGVFLAVMIIAPAWYYVGGDDERDERFAWRMFSSVRMTRCRIDWRVGAAKSKAKLSHTFHEAWLGLARRGREMVIEAMTERLCDDNPGEPVYLQATCRDVNRQYVLFDGSKNLCEAEQ